MSGLANAPAGSQGGGQRGQYAAGGFQGHAAAAIRGGSLGNPAQGASPIANRQSVQQGGPMPSAAGNQNAASLSAGASRQIIASVGSSGMIGQRQPTGPFPPGSGSLSGSDVASLFAKASSAAPPGLSGGSATSSTGSLAFGAPPGFAVGQGRSGERDDASGTGSALGSQAPAVPPEAYGMAGLLGVLKAGDRDIPALALGTELTSPGFHLTGSGSSPHPLHALYASPWAKDVTPLEPHWTLPQSFTRMPQPALKTGHLAKFDVTTLLYIFYSMPKDVLQAYAAQELHGRDWRFHRDMKLWFKQEAGGKQGAPMQWMYFDLPTWDKRAYSGPVASLVSGFLSDEECRVKGATG